ncbi:pancreatic triacylglycerol lipase-like [Anopheles maculipalpis]|uniref:pancreatic triacylglycerol lipase-like n=1 Tax=Anopheles maculipalpis TaxID=1496333 RepID=UPI002159AF8C|nr:pancreatic triacylglycerol lipase-like [Anopheles maculipalpis]
MDFFSRSEVFGIVLLFALAINTSAVLNYDKELQEVKVYFFSPSLKHEEAVESFEPSPEIDLRRQLKVLIHGWNADRNHVSISPIRTAYLVQDAHNLLVVDWSKVAYLSYPTARRLVLPISNIIGNSLAKFIQRVGIEHSQVHVIGHSLGAHIAGNVGRYFKGELSRVTALDPAGPLFEFESNDAVGPDVAQFVDVIHTDGLTLGEDIVRGHVDFFPNGGIAPQPGCEVLDIVTLHGCSHFRAPAFFAESIQLPNNFIACACSREEIYRKDEICLPDVRETSLRECVAMGESLDPGVRGTFYVRTSRVPPYGLGQHTKSSEPSV